VKALKIISGGQTGVDRAALDVALRHAIECGGWCPAGRLDEFGKIPDHYPVQELQNRSFDERTLQNVKHSNGTVVIYSAELRGGTEQTVCFCVELERPHQLIDASKFSTEDAANLVADFVRENEIRILNIAGPRQSEWPEGYAYASRALDAFLKL
jgi:Circularly permutated YpsA SLOG family